MSKLPHFHLRRLVAGAAIARQEASRDAARLAAVPRWRLLRRRPLRQQAHSSAIAAATAHHMLTMALVGDCFDEQSAADDATRMIDKYIEWDAMQESRTYLMFALHRS
ncbi:hypothetical protein [Streptosporangium sp. CA-115845]|uniref:hypothetical protein n=1 Tax=Streptosporangium sp. CA-115845 TaxID=3240071 RepID=UPI003D942371